MTKLQWGVLGCASIAVNKVIPAMQRSQHCEVVAIGSRDSDRAADTASKLVIARSVRSSTGRALRRTREITSGCTV